MVIAPGPPRGLRPTVPTHISYTFNTSSPWWLITLMAILPVADNLVDSLADTLRIIPEPLFAHPHPRFRSVESLAGTDQERLARTPAQRIPQA